MKSMPGLPKLVQHLADYMQEVGIKVESDLTQSWKYTDPWCCQHYYTHAKLGQLNNGMPKDWTTSILAILEKWQDKIPDTEVLKRTGMQSVHTLLKLAQLKWTGYVTRMPDERLSKKILYGELQIGKRSHGGQKKRYKDILK